MYLIYLILHVFLHRRIYKMFKEIKKQKYNRTFIEEICCRSYANPLVEINPIICNIKGNMIQKSSCIYMYTAHFNYTEGSYKSGIILYDF